MEHITSDTPPCQKHLRIVNTPHSWTCLESWMFDFSKKILSADVETFWRLKRGDKRESGAEREPLSLPLAHQCSDVTGVAAFQNLETEKCVWNNSSLLI